MTSSGQLLSGQRVAQVLATSTGGVGTHLTTILPGLRDAGACVAVCGPAATDELFGFRAAGAAFHPVPIASGIRPAQNARALLSLRRALQGADLVHAHGLRAGALTMAARPQAPIVLTLHNSLLSGALLSGALLSGALLSGAPHRAVLPTRPGVQRRIGEVLERWTVRRADVVLGASLDLVEHARDIGGRDVRSGPVAAPPLPPATRNRAAVRHEIGVPESAPLLLAIGRLNAQKGYDTLLAAARAWRGRSDGLLVAIAGDGPRRAAISHQIDREGLPVRLLGRRSDIPDLLGACDLLVLTSRWEARALVVQEALRAGRPLVATAVGGIPELAGRGAGILIPPGNPDAVVAAVADVLADPVRAGSLVTAGFAAAASWPTVEDTVAQLSAVYAELLGIP